MLTLAEIDKSIPNFCLFIEHRVTRLEQPHWRRKALARLGVAPRAHAQMLLHS